MGSSSQHLELRPSRMAFQLWIILVLVGHKSILELRHMTTPSPARRTTLLVAKRLSITRAISTVQLIFQLILNLGLVTMLQLARRVTAQVAMVVAAPHFPATERPSILLLVLAGVTSCMSRRPSTPTMDRTMVRLSTWAARRRLSLRPLLSP